MTLIAHYPLNGDTKDYSGYGNDGVSTRAVVSNAGKIGKCYKFDGINSGVNIPSKNYSGMEVYSMSAWVKPLGNHKNYNGAVISSGNWNFSAWNFGLSKDNTKIDVASNGYNRYLDYPVPVGEWTHIICVAENNVTKVYVNGNYVGQVNATSKLTSNAANTYIGRETYAGGYFSFNGELNDIRIYDHALSEKEIKELAKAKVLHYKFDEQDLATKIIKDCSGFGNDGAVAEATAPSWSEDSPVGRGSMEFDGGKFITLPNRIGGDEQITVCAWFKANGSGGAGYHIIMGGLEVELDVTNAGQARFGLIVNNIRQVHNHSSGLADGKWHHICGVYDGTVKSIYVDGVLAGSDPAVGKIRNNFTRRLGVFGTATYYHANGNISDVRIYATALSPEDILEIYQTRSSIDNMGNLHVYESDEVNDGTSGITSQGIAKFSSVNEVGRPVRYIRDWSNGSTANTINHWVEIQAIDPSGTNVALGKSSPSALITDGSTATNPYYSAGSGLKSVTVDLGDTHNITYLHIWHYWLDGRIYYKTKTEVSTDGTNWVTVFDSAVEGEYAETPEGKKILLYPDKVSIDSDGNVYINEILEA